MKKIIALFTALLLMGWSINARSFACKNRHRRNYPHRRRLGQRIRQSDPGR